MFTHMFFVLLTTKRTQRRRQRRTTEPSASIDSVAELDQTELSQAKRPDRLLMPSGRRARLHSWRFERTPASLRHAGPSQAGPSRTGMPSCAEPRWARPGRTRRPASPERHSLARPSPAQREVVVQQLRAADAFGPIKHDNF